MKRILRGISLLIVIALLGGMFIGCGKDSDDGDVAGKPDTEDESKDKDDEKSDEDEKKDEEEEDDSRLTDEPVTLTYWANMDGSVSSQFDSLGEVTMYKELEKITGVEIEFIHPPAGESAGDSLNLLIVTGDLPDMIEWEWHNWPGGPEKALKDEVIIELNELIEDHAPNLQKVLAEDEYLDKSIKTDNGVYTAFPFYHGHESLMVYRGPIMRKDWLDDLGLDVPETVDDWYTVLKSFKENKDAMAPYTVTRTNIIRTGNIVSAYGATHKEFFNDNGQIKYGSMEPGYKDYLETMNRWYSEGLLDAEYATLDGDTYSARITEGHSGAIVHLQGRLRSWTDAMKEKDPAFEIIGVPSPSLEKGQNAMYGQRASTPQLLVAITPECEDKELATKWLDYGYGEEGRMLHNFGVEGISYDMIDGYPTYTKDITDNPDVSMGSAMSRHCRAGYRGPYIKDKRYFEQSQVYERQGEAVARWAEADGDTQIPLLTPTPEESERLADIIDEATKYVRSMSQKFISGEESIEKFDEYLENLRRIGIEEAIQIKQDALDRFYQR